MGRRGAVPEGPLTAPQLTDAQLFFGSIADRVDPGKRGATVRIADARELADYVADTWGVRVPDKRVCQGHCSPLDAMAAAYFAEKPRDIWYAARGFGGKSVLMAALAVTEAATLGAGVSILGGSGKQSKNVHDYMNGLGNMPGKFWSWPRAPREMLRSDPTGRSTHLSNGGSVEALLASSRAVRGPHPQRLRGDEVDEMDQDIWDAAAGMPKMRDGIRDHILASSTLQYPDGTFAEELKRAKDRGWRTWTWCYKELLAAGVVTQEEIDRKKSQVTDQMWKIEYDLQEPTPADRAILPEAVDAMFDKALGYEEEVVNRVKVFEPPVWELDPDWRPDMPRAERTKFLARFRCRYAAGADWGRDRDHTNVVVERIDVTPRRWVAFAHFARRPYPEMFKAFNELVGRYNAVSSHDETGLGKVAGDYVLESTRGVNMQGARRRALFSHYIAEVEGRAVVAPRIVQAYRAHKFVTAGDLYYGTGHPPDEFVAAALADAAARADREVMY